MSFGAGSIGKYSVSTIAKDFRDQLAADMTKTKAMSIEDISNGYFQFIKDEHYDKAYPAGGPNNPAMTVWVFGFSPGESLPEIWQFSLGDTAVAPKEAVAKKDGGMAFGGEPEVVQRLVMGYGTALRSHLEKLGVAKDVLDQAFTAQTNAITILSDAMPVQDAIDLAEFLVSATIEFSRFKMGAATVGGPVEVAAITKHEGFKWIKRKHYFNTTLNPINGG
jgi:hypothetical protein